MLSLKIDDILDFLLKEKFPVQIQKETQQIFMVFKIDNREFPFFIRIFPGGDLLQLISFIPCNLKDSAYGDLARLLHMLNKELDVPGFGMDENADLVFYRVMLPATDKKINENHLKRFIQSIEQILKNFSTLIAMIAFGTTSFDEVKKQVKPLQPQK